MSSIVSSKGRVTIPKRVRDYLGITPGTTVDFVLAADGRIVLEAGARKVRDRSRFARIRGSASVKMSTDQILALTRGE